MYIYHISSIKNIKLNDRGNTEFIPRMPNQVVCDINSEFAQPIEDFKTKRICFSESIAGAISASPTLQYNLHRNLTINSHYIIHPFIYVYFINTDDLEKEFFISNKELIDNGLVYDAKFTKECWYTKPLELKPHLFKINELTTTKKYDTSGYTESDIIDHLRPIYSDKYIKYFEQFSINDLLSYVFKSKEIQFDNRNELMEIYSSIDCREIVDHLKGEFVFKQ